LENFLFLSFSNGIDFFQKKKKMVLIFFKKRKKKMQGAF